MPGAFEESLEPEFELDALRTAEEIQRCGEETLRWIESVAASASPRPIDHELIKEIHRRWFSTTFPVDAGNFRTSTVVNRKGTAAPIEGVLPGVIVACENWAWRRANCRPEDAADEIEFIIAEAHTLTVAVYDVHPFVDGNTRATWHLRNYALMIDGLRPLLDPGELETYEDAWWDATPLDHERLDQAVLEILSSQDR